MKKILAILCAIALVCSLAMVASAEETAIYSDPVTVGSGWQTMVQINTVAWGGNLDPAVIVEGGVLEVNLSCTTDGLWSTHVVMQGTEAANYYWIQIDKDVSALTVNEDGSYTATFTYEELTAALGTNSLADMGALYVYANSADGASVTLNKVAYVVASAEEYPAVEPEPTVQPDPTNPKDGDAISAVVALLAVSACGIAVLSKKKEF